MNFERSQYKPLTLLWILLKAWLGGAADCEPWQLRWGRSPTSLHSALFASLQVCDVPTLFAGRQNLSAVDYDTSDYVAPQLRLLDVGFVGFGACSLFTNHGNHGDFGGCRDALLEKPDILWCEAPKPEGEEEQEDLEDPDASIYNRFLRMFDRNKLVFLLYIPDLNRLTMF